MKQIDLSIPLFDLAQSLFDETAAQLEQQGLLLRQDTTVDAALIMASP